MARRTAGSHAGAMLEHLRPGMRLLDVGCGPGTISVGLARLIAPGTVVAVDAEPGQVELARRRADAEDVANLETAVADALALPLADASVDAAFCHALLEHLVDPVAAIREMARAVRPGGPVVAVCPDWGGFLLAPADEAAERAIAFYERLQATNGGDVRAGRRLGAHMAAAGLADVRMSARYEVYEDRGAIAGYLAARIARSPDLDDAVARGWGGAGEIAALADALREWSARPDGLFAQAWVSATGWVPPA
jgi:SAM-dependent methyltransferase